MSPVLPRVVAEPDRSPRCHLTEPARKDDKGIINAETSARARDTGRDRDTDRKSEALREKRKKKKIYVSL